MVDSACCLGQTPPQHHFVVVAALCLPALGRQSRTMHLGEPLARQQLDGKGFNGCFGEHSGASLWHLS